METDMDKQKFYTPHINATPDDFAKTVLMPGDPLRSKFIAENFLTDARLVNNVRGIGGYTGYYKGVRVSVMASGMGMPSMGIYSYELYNLFGVENIIRIGSAGGICDEIEVRDILFAMSASTTSSFANQYMLEGTMAPIASYELLKVAVAEAEQLGVRHSVGNILSSDMFYNANPDAAKKWRDMGVLATEMETAALYLTAAYSKKRALSILTVSDHLFREETLSAEQRQTSLTDMMTIALETAIKL